MIQKNKTFCLCFIDYAKAFDRVQHNKLIDMMEIIGIPFHERRLTKNIYWNQMAEIKVNDEISEKINVRRELDKAAHYRRPCSISTERE